MSLLALILVFLAGRTWQRHGDPAGALIVASWRGTARLVARISTPMPPWAAAAVFAAGLLATAWLVSVVLASWPPVLVLIVHVAALYYAVDVGLLGDALRAVSRGLPGSGARPLEEARSATAAASDAATAAVGDAPTRSTPGGSADADSPLAPSTERHRAAIEALLLRAHRELLAPVLAYVLVPGLSGLLAYVVLERLARRLANELGDDPADGPAAGSTTETGAAAVESVEGQAVVLAPGETGASSPGQPLAAEPAEERGAGADRVEPCAAVLELAYRWADWLPLRVTAALFAVAGNFEDATYCWRGASAATDPLEQRALLLAVGGGALGVRLADPELADRWREASALEWQADDPDGDAVHGATGLVSRSVAMLAALILLGTVASW